MQDFDWKTFFSTVVPLIVLVISPLLSLYIAKKQISATVVSNFRKEWINEFRLNVSKFMAAAMVASLIGRIDINYTDEQIYNHSQELFFLSNQIELMLDFQKPSHSDLDKSLNATVLLIIDEIKSPIKHNSDLVTEHMAKIKTLCITLINPSCQL